MHWHKVYNLPVNVIRIFNAFGTRSKTEGTYGAVFGVFWLNYLVNLLLLGMVTKRDFYMLQCGKSFYKASKTKSRRFIIRGW